MNTATIAEMIKEMAFQGLSTHNLAQLVKWFRMVQADHGRWPELAVLLCLREAPPEHAGMRLDVVNMLRDRFFGTWLGPVKAEVDRG